MTADTAARPPPSLAILVAVTAMGPLALNIFMPSMPAMPGLFDTDYATVQLTLSLFLGGLAVSQLLYGPLADRFGRRPLLLIGVALFLAGSLLALFAASIEMLIAGRLIQAVGGCAGLVLGRAIVRDLYERDKAASVIAYMIMAMVVAPMLGPLIGGYLHDWFSWRATFVLVAVFAAVVFAAVLLLAGETLPAPQPLPGITGLLRAYGRLLRRPLFCGYAGQTALSSAGFFAFLGGAPYVVVDIMGRPAKEYGVYFALTALGYMFGNYLSGRMAVRVGIERMIGAGVTISFLGAAAMTVFGAAGALTPLALFGPMVLYSVGNGLSLPNGIAGAVSVDPLAAGTASGLSGFMQMAIGAGASVLTGVLIAGADSQLPLTLVMLATTVLAILAHLATLRALRAAAPAPISQESARPAG